ncbi:MAG: MgtC/SapB family protein [Rhodoferax sp.]|uniref:MgtC/SapB family protein n=1 Tax=Rhodoferax sp. TaxID=50421 RepID=UPI00261BA55A|nr:MgtC/SapB family protein [Rhodoferax sp.]MDD5336349.1 MgtC/SapB family protein [Rhodoferax sp.]
MALGCTAYTAAVRSRNERILKISSFADSSTLLGLCVALGIGLLIGAERERRKSSGPTRNAAGIRTFAVSALLGAVGVILGGGLLLAVIALLVGAGTWVAYRRTCDLDPGITTEFALLLTCLLGGLAIQDSALAAAIGALLAVLLAARDRLHHFVRSVLTAQELHDILLFSAVALIVLPLAPDRFIGPFDALNPRAMAGLVVLMMAISALGYVAMRSVGPRYGLPLAGFAAGFVSSTATIYAMGERASKQGALRNGAVAGALLSSIATILQMTVVIGLIRAPLLNSLVLPLTFGGLAAGLYGLLFMLWGLPGGSANTPDQDAGRAFELKTAASFAVLVACVLLLSAALNAWLGSRGMLLGAAVTGLADAHATAASVASLAAANKISSAQAVGPILLGLSSNTLMKALVAFRSGGLRYAACIVPGLLLMIGAVWLGAWLAG